MTRSLRGRSWRSRCLSWGFALGLVLCWYPRLSRSGQAPRVYKGKEEKLPIKVAPQPVAFSHKKHAFITCLECHEGATKAEVAGYPEIDKCMLCHTTIKADSPEIKKLAAFESRGENIKWVPVYEVPDFVFFSHASHAKAGVKCATCHGSVEKQDVLEKEVSTNMISCINCHSAKKAPTTCYICHQLGF